MTRERNEFFELFEQAATSAQPSGPHDVWEEITRCHERDRTVPARLVGRDPHGWAADVFGLRAVLSDDAVDPDLASGLALGRTVDAWILKYHIDRGELFLYFVDKSR
jgi:hypothetical protein